MYEQRIRPYQIKQRHYCNAGCKTCDCTCFSGSRPAENAEHAREQLTYEAVAYQQDVYKLARICHGKRECDQEDNYQEQFSLNLSFLFRCKLCRRRYNVMRQSECAGVELRLCR